jgi:MFS family permease
MRSTSRRRPFTVGALLSLYALLPMLLAVAAGRLIDRVGVARPMAWAGVALVAGIALPGVWPSLDALFVAATLIGLAFMVYHVALNHTVGSMGAPADRAVNFSWFALGFSVGGFCGPLLTGFAIDALGHRAAFLMLAAFPAAGLCALYLVRRRLPVRHPQHARNRRAPRRRPVARAAPARAFVASALLATGWDLYTFVIPIYGSSVGLSASTIGIVMGSLPPQPSPCGSSCRCSPGGACANGRSSPSPSQSPAPRTRCSRFSPRFRC